MASLLRQRAKTSIRALHQIGMLFASSSGPTRYDGTKAKNYGKQVKFSVGDIVGLIKYPEHKGYVVEVLETKGVRGAMPTIIVDWFNCKATTWDFEDELYHISESVSDTTDL